MQPVIDLYKHPSFPDSAKLYFDLPLKVYVSLFSDEKCALGEYGTLVNYDHFTGDEEVDGYRPRHSFEGKMPSINIEPNNPLIVNFTHEENKIDSYKGVKVLSMCRLTYHFTPLENHNYVAVYEFKDDGCRATIFDLTQSRANNELVMATGLRAAAKNCDIYEYYSRYRSK
jgi:hypothetical protein